MQPPKVLVALLTWNQKSDTLECIASLRKVHYGNHQIVVVDNGSTDGTAEAVRSGYSDIHVVVEPINSGCAEGFNCMIRFALKTDAEFVFLLGNDTIVDPGVIDELVAVATLDKKIGITCPKVYYYDRPNTLWFARGGCVNWRKGRFEGYVQNVVDDGSYDTSEGDFEVYPGGFSFVRRAALEQGVWFDPGYNIYFDDSDWYVRLKKKGWRYAYAPKAKVWHKPSSSVGRDTPAFYYYRTRNRLLFMKKNAKVRDLFYFVPHFILEYFWHVVYPLVREKKWHQLLASGQGLIDFFCGKFGLWKAS